MKSVLVIDKPVCCDECELMYQWIYDKMDRPFCPLVGYIDTHIDSKESMHPDCPLVDLPNKEVANPYDFEHYSNGVSIGWNNFRDKIYKEKSNDVPTA